LRTFETIIADAQSDVPEALRQLLKGEGYQVKAVTSSAAVLGSLQGKDFDVLVICLNRALDTASGQEGLDLLARSRTRSGEARLRLLP
jgi:CheY-like chemotaxis protein